MNKTNSNTTGPANRMRKRFGRVTGRSSQTSQSDQFGRRVRRRRAGRADYAHPYKCPALAKIFRMPVIDPWSDGLAWVWRVVWRDADGLALTRDFNRITKAKAFSRHIENRTNIDRDADDGRRSGTTSAALAKGSG